MKRLFLLLAIIGAGLSLQTGSEMAHAQANGDQAIIDESNQTGDFPTDEFYRAKVVKIIWASDPGSGGMMQLLRVLLLSGPEKGEEIEIRHGDVIGVSEEQQVREGEGIVVAKSYTVSGVRYFVADRDRLPALALVVGLFFALVIWMGRLKGLMSIVGLAVSILILSQFIVPQIVSGSNPLLITIAGALMIACTSLFLAHGYNRRTMIAFISTLITLAIAIGLAVGFVIMTKLFGAGSEDAFFLAGNPAGAINLRGLLLGGIIIGTLGVLDDITTAQVAAVDEIRLANERLTVSELYKRGISVGREHIASLVNTLVLAYAGVAMPLFLAFTIYKTQPLWVALNGEGIAEEIIRTMVGSMALVLAVPIATYLAAYLLKQPPTWLSRIGVGVSSSHRH